jgi:cob(I)alamin adenosyltransferase
VTLSLQSAPVRIYTRRGDDGTTGLFHGGRVPKDGPAPEACGAVDEAVSALGLARSIADGALADVLLEAQRDLFVVGAELATAAENRSSLEEGASLVTSDMVLRLEGQIDALQEAIPDEFVVPGGTDLAARIDMARSITRRAERRAVTHLRGESIEESQVVPYLNRLGDYLYVLARSVETDWIPSRRSE